MGYSNFIFKSSTKLVNAFQRLRDSTDELAWNQLLENPLTKDLLFSCCDLEYFVVHEQWQKKKSKNTIEKKRIRIYNQSNSSCVNIASNYYTDQALKRRVSRSSVINSLKHSKVDSMGLHTTINDKTLRTLREERNALVALLIATLFIGTLF